MRTCWYMSSWVTSIDLELNLELKALSTRLKATNLRMEKTPTALYTWMDVSKNSS